MPVEKDPRTQAIIGAALEVHRHLGSGFLEAVYQEALALEMVARGIPFRREVELPIQYKNTKLATAYKADFVCFDSFVVESKALSRLSGPEESQILHYLRASGLETGLLLNFGSRSLELKRFVFSQSVKSV